MDWIAINGKGPGSGDFGLGAGKVGLSWPSFVHLFPNSSEAWLFVYNHAKERGIPFQLLNTNIHKASPEVRALWRKEADDLVVDWIEKNRQRIEKHNSIQQSDFETKDLPVSVPLFFSGTKGVQAYHENPIEAWLSIYHLCKERGVKFYLLDVTIENPSAEIREIWKKEAVDRYVDWMVLNKRWPNTVKDYGTGDGKLVLNAGKLFGGIPYKEGMAQASQRLFDSFEDAKKAFCANRTS